MERFSRYLFLSVLGVGVFSVIVLGFFDVVEGQPLQGLVVLFFGVFIGTGGLKLDRDHLRPH